MASSAAGPEGRVAYEPNSLDPAGPRESPERGFTTFAAQNTSDEQGDKLQNPPGKLRRSLQPGANVLPLDLRAGATPLVSAFGFELAKVETWRSARACSAT